MTNASLFHGKNDSVESSVHASTRTDHESEQIRLVDAPGFLRAAVFKRRRSQDRHRRLRSADSAVSGAYLPDVKVLYVEYHSERDRRMIDGILAETHVLWRGHVKLAYRGEFCYLKRELVPDESQTHTCEILLNLD